MSKPAVEDHSKGRTDEGWEPKLIAYRTGPWPPMRLVTASSSRDWMDATPGRFANRCLPLRIANQAGWFVLNSHALRVTWNGGNGLSDLEVESLDAEASCPASSHFGSGILTFNLPFLFRTPAGYNLHVRGPANWPKDGAYALEGIVETDWAVSTFTMNWKIMRANLPVIFEVGEPICMIVPQRRGELEAFRPEIHEIEEEPEHVIAYRQWAESRSKFNRELKMPESEAAKRGWQKDYVQGTIPGGLRAKEHQTKLKLKDFNEVDSSRSAETQIHTIFSVDGSLYQRWQADLLAHTHQKAGQPGPLTRLLAADGPPSPFGGRTFQTEPYCPHAVTGDYYPPYNKIMTLKAWIEESPPKEETVLLLDPDCVFLKPLTGSVSRGHPVSQFVGHMDPAYNQELVKKHCTKPDLVDSVGIPTLIHRDDLRALVPLWIKKTEEIRNDPKSRALAGNGGWIADMWGYTLAAAELGLEHQMRDLARFSSEDRADLPVIHYCYPFSDAKKHWAWDKRSYRPWERVPDPTGEVPLALRVLIDLLNEWVAKPEHQICLH